MFEEPLVPSNAGIDKTENVDLANALLRFTKRTEPDDVSAITDFLAARPYSRWRISLLTDLGIIYRRAGWHSKALEALEEAWAIGQTETDPQTKAMVDRAVGELAQLTSSLGRFERLASLFSEIGSRNLVGRGKQEVAGAREGYALMIKRPDLAFRCGPMALQTIRKISLQPSKDFSQDWELLFRSKSSKLGMSLSEVAALATSSHLDYQMAKRTSFEAEIPLPAVVHWKVNHYAAITKKTGDRYLVQDPTFDRNFWMTRNALDSEASGSFLLPAGALPSGWQPVSRQEGANIWGKGNTNQRNDHANTDHDHHVPPPTPNPTATPNPSATPNPTATPCTCEAGMPSYTFSTMLTSLRIEDTPLRYTPPVGPAISFTVVYNQRESDQPSIFDYSNLGANWTFNWLSYVVDDPFNPASDVLVYTRGGGADTFTGYDSATQSYAPEQMTQDILVRTSSDPITYELRHKDGSITIYSVATNATSDPRNIFMTQSIDPMGNAVTLTYDNSFRVVSIGDAIDQVTNLSYNDPSNPLKITKITDPFGRFATLEYNSEGELSKVTDEMGMTSDFTYGDGDFITSMTTPYGTTYFNTEERDFGDTVEFSSIQATDPLGQTERLEMWQSASYEFYDPINPPIVSGCSFFNAYLNNRSCFYWDKTAQQLHPYDLNFAHHYQFLHDVDGNKLSRIMQDEKAVNENRIWYWYPTQTVGYQVSSLTMPDTPSTVARVLDDGSTQAYLYEYNSVGNTTKITDPLGRITTFTYDSTNQTDLLEVRQQTRGINELLASFTYNTQHEPLIATDVSGQKTVFSYYSNGHLKTLENALHQVTTFNYDSNGYLQNIVGHVPGDIAQFTYDGLGRVRTVADSEGYTITIDYDNLDRPITVTYPDGTFETTVWDKMEVGNVKDRLGRWSTFSHDANRRLTLVTDPLQRLTQLLPDADGRLIELTDPAGNITKWTRDLQGRVTQKTYADQKTETYNYERTTSRLLNVIDAKGQKEQFVYNLDNTIKKIDYLDAFVATPSVSFTYDPNYPRRSTMTDGIGLTSYSYNPVTMPPALGADRLLNIDGPLINDTIGYTYDQLGRIKTRSINAVNQTIAYDALGRLSGVQNALGSFLYQYLNATPRLKSVAYPNGLFSTLDYYDNLGDQRLKTLTNVVGGTQSQFDYVYDVVGRVTSWTQQADAATPHAYSLEFDEADQLLNATLQDAGSGDALKRYSYEFDSAGNRTTEQIDNAATTSIFNNLNQLTLQQNKGSIRVHGSLSEPAIVSLNGSPAIAAADNTFEGHVALLPGTRSLTVTATDYSGNNNTTTSRYNVTVGSGAQRSLTYDGNGNLSQIVDGGTFTTLTWDAADRCTQIKSVTGATTNLVTMAYDGLGRRTTIAQKLNNVTQSTNKYLFEGLFPVQERNSAGATVTKQFFDQGEMVGAAKHYFSYDRLGSIRESVSSTGVLESRFDYSPFGAASTVSGIFLPDFGFQGMQVLRIGNVTPLNLTWGRIYDPALGMWHGRDPIREKGGSNLYQFVRNNPVSRIDPLGLDDEEVPSSGDYLEGLELQQCLAGGEEGMALCLVKAAGERAAEAGGRRLFDWLCEKIKEEQTPPPPPIGFGPQKHPTRAPKEEPGKDYWPAGAVPP